MFRARQRSFAILFFFLEPKPKSFSFSNENYVTQFSDFNEVKKGLQFWWRICFALSLHSFECWFYFQFKGNVPECKNVTLEYARVSV